MEYPTGSILITDYLDLGGADFFVAALAVESAV
jgi:hypothetical protein